MFVQIQLEVTLRNRAFKFSWKLFLLCSSSVGNDHLEVRVQAQLEVVMCVFKFRWKCYLEVRVQVQLELCVCVFTFNTTLLFGTAFSSSVGSVYLCVQIRLEMALLKCIFNVSWKLPFVCSNSIGNRHVEDFVQVQLEVDFFVFKFG